jgi:hypothetical protein
VFKVKLGPSLNGPLPYMRQVCVAAIMQTMRRTVSEPERDLAAYPMLLRSGALAAALAGVLFVAWGYFDQEYAPVYFYVIVRALAFIVPLLFTVGLATVYARSAGRTDWPAKIGIILASIGSVLGAVRALVKLAVPLLYPYNALSGRILLLLGVWAPTLFVGLLLGGLVIAATGTSRNLGTLLLAMGVFGWGYYITDSDAILEARSIHIGFGLLFSLGWVALGIALWLAAVVNRTGNGDEGQSKRS